MSLVICEWVQILGDRWRQRHAAGHALKAGKTDRITRACDAIIQIPRKLNSVIRALSHLIGRQASAETLTSGRAAQILDPYSDRFWPSYVPRLSYLNRAIVSPEAFLNKLAPAAPSAKGAWGTRYPMRAQVKATCSRLGQSHNGYMHQFTSCVGTARLSSASHTRRFTCSSGAAQGAYSRDTPILAARRIRPPAGPRQPGLRLLTERIANGMGSQSEPRVQSF